MDEKFEAGTGPLPEGKDGCEVVPETELGEYV
jgi:hypothetical protein